MSDRLLDAFVNRGADAEVVPSGVRPRSGFRDSGRELVVDDELDENTEWCVSLCK